MTLKPRTTLKPIAQARNREGITGEICPLCGRSGQKVGVKEEVILRECRAGHPPVLLAWAWPAGTEGEAAYQAHYGHPTAYHVDEAQANGLPAMADREAEYRLAAFHRLRFLSAVAPSPYTRSLLDVGAGTGAFVSVADSELFNFDAAGLEPNAAMVRAAQVQKVPLEIGGWENVQGFWDVITLHDVLEHVTRPFACLATLRAHLAEDGILVIEWPEYQCIASCQQGLAWKHVKPRQHVCLYSDRAAQMLFRRAGLRLIASHLPKRGEIGKIAYYLEKDALEKDAQGTDAQGTDA